MLLKVKNGTPPQRKSALRQLTDKARELGAGPLFNQILPLLMAPTLEDQERHLLVKVHTLTVKNLQSWAPKLVKAENGSLWCQFPCEQDGLITKGSDKKCNWSTWNSLSKPSSTYQKARRQITFATYSEEVLCRSLIVFCTSWMSWWGHSCIKFLLSLSRCWLMRITTQGWKDVKSSQISPRWLSIFIQLSYPTGTLVMQLCPPRIAWVVILRHKRRVRKKKDLKWLQLCSLAVERTPGVVK